MSLGDLWQLLEQQTSGGRGMLVRSAHAGSNCAVLAALTFPGAERALVIRLPEHEARALASTGLTPAIELTLQEVGGSHPGQGSVLLRTRDPRYRELFTHIGDDLVEQLRRDPARPVQALLQRVELWREFLRRREGGALTEAEIRGLFGEAWFLQNWLISRTAAHNHVAAIAAWTGPLGATRDFNLGEASLDMKTGTPLSSTVQISSLHQLSTPPGTRLYLGHLILRRDAGGQTLPELIDVLRDMLGAEARALLEARLLGAGYIEADRETLQDLRFLAGPLTTYAITPDFPALTPQNLPPAVVACSYTLDLGACVPFRIDPADIPGIGETHRSLHEY